MQITNTDSLQLTIPTQDLTLRNIQWSRMRCAKELNILTAQCVIAADGEVSFSSAMRQIANNMILQVENGYPVFRVRPDIKIFVRRGMDIIREGESWVVRYS